MDLHRRRYAPWLLDNEERLTRRRDLVNRLTMIGGFLIALLEALWNWNSYTPDIAPLVHIALVALLLPVLYFMLQTDYRTKLASFTQVMGDLGRRLYFLDHYLDLEEFELQQRMSGAMLQPTQRAIDKALRTGESQSLRRRVDYFYRALPSPICEGDRMGFLSILHPRTAISWTVAIFLIWALHPGGIDIGTANGFTWMCLLLPLYLTAAHFNARFAYELSLFNWLRLG